VQLAAIYHDCGMNHFAKIVFALLLVVTSSTLAFAKPMALPGSNWTLDLPDGFAIEQKVIPSFVNKDGAAIVIFDAPPQSLKSIPLPKVGDVSDVGIDNESKLEALEAVTIDGHAGWFLQQRFMKQNATGLTLLVEGRGSNANVVTRLTDAQMKTIKIEALRAVFLTLREKILSDEERLSALPFEIRDAKGFNLAAIIGNSIAVFTDGPERNIELAPKQASVSVVLSPAGPSDLTPEMLAIFDKQGMMDGLLKHQFPGAVAGEHKAIMAGETPALHIPFSRVSETDAVKLKGDVRFLLAGKKLLMIYSSYPEGDEEKAAAVQKLVESIAMKKGAQ
jgi:hypothetical protein